MPYIPLNTTASSQEASLVRQIVVLTSHLTFILSGASKGFCSTEPHKPSWCGCALRSKPHVGLPGAGYSPPPLHLALPGPTVTLLLPPPWAVGSGLDCLACEMCSVLIRRQGFFISNFMWITPLFLQVIHIDILSIYVVVVFQSELSTYKTLVTLSVFALL